MGSIENNYLKNLSIQNYFFDPDLKMLDKKSNYWKQVKANGADFFFRV